MALRPVIISDFVREAPSLASTPSPAPEDAPWLAVLSDRQRREMQGFAAVIWPDRPITRRLTRHLLTTPTGHKFAALKTIEECWLYAQAMELEPVGLGVGDRVISLNPIPSPRPLSCAVPA